MEKKNFNFSLKVDKRSLNSVISKSLKEVEDGQTYSLAEFEKLTRESISTLYKNGDKS